MGSGLIATLTLEDEAATAQLARSFAPHLRAGDVIGLNGGLGVGKTSFARALIGERLAQRGSADTIPSPSFTLVQTYDLGSCELWHADLYRLGTMDEIVELGLEEAFSSAICVVEWADRLIRHPSRLWPARSLTIALSFVPGIETARRAHVEATGSGWDWLVRAIARTRAILS